MSMLNLVNDYAFHDSKRDDLFSEIKKEMENNILYKGDEHQVMNVNIYSETIDIRPIDKSKLTQGKYITISLVDFETLPKCTKGDV